MNKALSFFILLLLYSNSLLAQGPGGIGTTDGTSELKLWLKADGISGLNDGEAVSSWSDASGSGNDINQGLSASQPVYKVNVLNSLPTVRLDGINDFLNTSTALGTFTDWTLIAVVKSDDWSSASRREYISTLEDVSYGTSNKPLNFAIEAGNLKHFRGEAAGEVMTSDVSTEIGWHTTIVSQERINASTVNLEMYFDGILKDSDAGNYENLKDDLWVGGNKGINNYWDGDIAEIILYNNKINSAQRIIIDNYLSSKYGITAFADYYSFESTHSNEVAGIGREDVTNVHASAFSSSLLGISNSSGMDTDGEYLLFGHDNGDASVWTASGAPEGGSYIRRVARSWRINETGDLGTVKFTVDNSELPDLPGDIFKYALIVDEDGDFSNGAATYELTSPGADQFYEIDGLDINDGDFVTIGIINPVVQFTAAGISSSELNDVSVDVELNYVPANTVSVDYETQNVPASAQGGNLPFAIGDDYETIPTTTLNFFPGETSKSVSVNINQDTELENDEQFKIVLTNPIGLGLDANDELAYTIQDDDNPRKIYFDEATSSGSEGAANVAVKINITPSQVDNTNPTTVGYTVTGGNALGGGVDYTLASGTLTIPANFISGSFHISLNDDAIDELDETVIITLSNPTNSNLSTNDPVQHTFTILDNEIEPSVQFTTTGSSGAESSSPASFTVELSAISAKDIIVDYTVTGTASGSGVDFSLNNGSLTIPAGELIGTISAVITDDALIEPTETLTIIISSATNATIGSNNNHTYSILDDDGEFGFQGPGGVGKSINNKLWFRADVAVFNDAGINQASDGETVQEWHDISGNSFNAGQLSLANKPSYISNQLNGHPVLRFNGSNSFLENSSSIGTYSDWTIITVVSADNWNTGARREFFTTLEDVSYGSSNKPLNYGIEGGVLKHFRGEAAGQVMSTNVAASAGWHIAAFTQERTSSSNVNLEMFFDGSLVDTDMGNYENLKDDFWIGSAKGSSNFWDGDIAEIIVYDSKLNTARKKIVENYLAAKYGLIIGSDLYSYEVSHGHGVAGIGRDDADNQHLEAQSNGMLKVSEASSLGNGEYLLFGYDAGDMSAWTAVEAPDASFQRIAREWRLDETGDVGTVTFTLDQNTLPLLPANYQGYTLLIDADGDFTSGAAQYPMILTNGYYEAAGVDFNDGDYIAFATSGNTLTFSMDSSSSSEGAGNVNIEVSLSSISSVDVTVDIALSGTALNGGVDYTLNTISPLTIPAGNLTGNISISLSDDALTEQLETIIIDISNPSNATLGSITSHTLAINDNDNTGFTGPGGVGDFNNNKLWLKADALAAAVDGSAVNAWPDVSGNANDFGLDDKGQSTIPDAPSYYNGVLKGKPVVRFDGVDDFMTANSIISGTTGRTIFILSKMTASTGNNDGLLLQLNYPQSGGSGAKYSVTPEVALRVSGNRVFNESFGTTDFRLLTLSHSDNADVDEVSMYLEGVVGSPNSANSALINTGTNGSSIGWSDHVNEYLNGDMAEVIAYDQELNTAQRIIVENYLAAKYGLAVNNDKYAYEATHGEDVAGIGREDASNIHTIAQSAGILRISNASDLDADGDYLLFGHDGGAITAWTSNEVAGAEMQRIAREWRLDATGTDAGSITLTLDPSTLPVLPGGYTQYVTLIDSDGDFANGALTYPLVQNGAVYEVNDLDFNDGDYVTFAIIRPTVQFTLDSSNGVESDTPANIEVSLNYALNQDVTIDYTVTGGTATGGGVDFTLANGTITIPAGETTINILPTIVDDGIIENDETILLSLSNPSAGISLGATDTHTFTINDDDHIRKIDFTLANSEGSEGTSQVFLTIRLNQTDAINPTSVDYDIIGGTAAGGGVDYLLTSGTATINAGEVSTTISVAIEDDLLYEPDETIEISLSNPANANLGANTSHTYTILENENVPEIQFAIASSNGGESARPATVTVILSSLSSEDATVDYAVTGGDATSGSDFNLANGTLTIPAAYSSGDISMTIMDDLEVEAEETIVITLSNPSTGTILGTKTVHTYTVNDNDNQGFTGPGGVGDKNINKLWLKADGIDGFNDGAALTTWEDASKNDHHAFNLSPGQEPTYATDQLNGYPVVRFDDDGGVNGDYLGANLSLGVSGSGAATVFMVAKNATAADEDNTGLFLGQASGANQTIRHYGVEYGLAVRFNNGYRVFDDGYSMDDWKIGTIRNFSGAEYGQYEGFINGNLLLEIDNRRPTRLPNTAEDLYYIGAGLLNDGSFSSSRFLDGDLAEVILYNADLNEAQRIIVENYLAAKYNLAVTNDHYAFEKNYGQEVAGIGRETATDIHTVAQSAGLLKVSNASSLDNNGDYLLFGHDGQPVNAWVTTEVPDATIQRLERTWRVDESGDIGTVSIALSTAGLQPPPAGFTQYVVMVDTDGDFNSGVQVYPMEISGSNRIATQIDINDGDYVAFGILKPEVQFVSATSNALEDINPVSIEVNLNYPVNNDLTVDYTVSGGTASNGGVDYSLANGTLQVPAGSTTAYIEITVVDDDEVEVDETITLTLSNPNTGILGLITSHSHTINDNDNFRKANFVNADSLDLENQSPIDIDVFLSAQDPSNVTKVFYKVSGGTATGSGTDYTLANGTLTYAAGDTLETISIDIVDDLLNEADETIIVSLTGGENTTLGDTVMFTYTIQDNDLEPEIQFSSASLSGSESFQTVLLYAELSAPSGKEVNVAYTVSGGSASAGSDFSFGNGNFIIPAGNTADSVILTVFDDTIEEPTETINFVLSGPANATLGANTSLTYSILDNDGLGYEGAGGVANLTTQTMMWLRSDAAPGNSDGNPVSLWKDQSANDNDAFQTGTQRPTYFNNPASNWNGKPVIQFRPAFSQVLGVNDTDDINTGGPYDKKTVLVAFRTSLDVTSRQMLYEEGGGVRGLSIYIDQGTLHVGGYNENDDDAGQTTPWSYTEVTSPVNANSNYFVMLQFEFDGDPTDGFIGDVTGYLNGTFLGVLPGAGRLFRHPGDIAIGGVRSGTVFHDGSGGSGSYFNGNIAEVIVTDLVYNEAQIQIVNNYFGAKYNITIPDDVYAHAIDHSWEVFGIGQKDAGNSHNIAKGSGAILIENPSSLNDGEYLVIGHDNAGIKEITPGDGKGWNNNEVPGAGPNFLRIAREWRADETGDIGTVDVRVEMNSLDPAPIGFSTYVLMIDDDGDFSSGAEVLELTDAGGGFVKATGVDLSGDKYISIGLLKPSIKFSQAASNGSEIITNSTLEVSLNFQSTTPISADYKVTGGTATSGPDYTLASGTITVPAGSYTANIPLTVVNDVLVEADETIQVTLSNPSGTAILGANDKHIYTINDDDNPRKIQFSVQEDGNTEDQSPVVVEVFVNNADAVNETTVDYTVTGGTAVGGGVDYTLAVGTASIPASVDPADTIGSFNLVINDDLINEIDETILITLSNPVNANLGDTTVYTYTILDNDSEPSIQYTSNSAAGAESFSPIDLPLELSAASGNDITVYYSVSSGTAFNGGIDFTIFEPGSVTIPSGEISDSIRFSIFNDNIQEGSETVIVRIDSLKNATLGASLEFTYTIIDDDGFGFIGPGGVGDSDDHQTWLKADNITGLSDGADMSVPWADVSVNGNDAFQNTVASQPVYETNAVNGWPAISFDGTDDFLEIANDKDLNTGGPYTQKTLILAFQTGTNVTSKQVIYEQGGGSRGLNIYIENGNIYVGAHNRVDDDGPGSAWGYNFVNDVVNVNTSYFVMLEYDQNNSALKAYLDGDLIGTSTGLGTLFSHGGDIGLGAMHDNSYFADGNGSGDDFYFDGKIMEFLSHNKVLNSAQKKLMDNYFSSKYGIGINASNEAYSFDTTHFYEVFGIGRDDSNNAHIIGQGSGIVKFDNPGSISDGDFLLAGHDNGSLASWSNANSPHTYIQIVDRTWRVDKTSDPGAVQLGVDTTAFPAPPANYKAYVILVDSDGDSDFTTGSPIIQLLNGRFGNLARTTINLQNGDIFTFGVARNVTVNDGNWNDPNTWLVSVPLPNDEVLIRNDVSLTDNATVGAVEIKAGASLDLNDKRLILAKGGISNNGTFDASTGEIDFASSIPICIEPLNYYDLRISGSGTKTLCGDIIVLNDIEIFGSATLDTDPGNNFNISVSGNWNSSSGASFNHNSSTVTFNGNGLQLIDKAGDQHFNNLVINKASGNVRLQSGDVFVANSLNLNNGNIILGTNDLYITNTSAINGAGADSYIQADGTGMLRWNITLNNNMLFPVGDSDEYSPFTLRMNAGTLSSARISINVKDASHAQIAGVVPDQISRYWTVNPLGIANPDYNVVYEYTDADVVGDESRITPAKYSGGDWETGGIVDIANNLLSWNNITSFSDFTGGNPAFSPLPIELVHFDVEMAGKSAVVTWSTASETNNDFFEVQRSLDGKDFTTIGIVDGNGNSSSMVNYTFIDEHPAAGLSYYRLKQVDYDGLFDYSPIISLNNPLDRYEFKTEVHPNPTVSDNLNVKILVGGQKGLLRISLYDTYGKVYFDEIVNAEQIEPEMRLNTGKNLRAGMYFLTVKFGNQVIQKKVIIH